MNEGESFVRMLTGDAVAEPDEQATDAERERINSEPTVQTFSASPKDEWAKAMVELLHPPTKADE